MSYLPPRNEDQTEAEDKKCGKEVGKWKRISNCFGYERIV
jgi:hypothetical protein